MKTSYIKPKNDFVCDGMYVFSKKVTLEKAETYKINIFTTGRYTLKINGKYICEGPCKGHEYVRYYDSVETDAFVLGENKIEIIVMHINDDKGFTTVHKTRKPEVIFEAVSENGRIATDEPWECRRDGRYTLSFAWWKFIAPFERVDFSGGYEDMEAEIADGFDFEKGKETSYGIAWAQLLDPRPIPMIYPDEEISFSVVKKGDGFLELDAGKYTTAKVEFLLAKNSEVKIIYSECYEKEDGKGIRDDSTGFLKGKEECFYDYVKTGDKDEVYSPFWYRAFRFIRIEAKNAEDVLKSAKAYFWHYPADFDGNFECSDESFNKMQEISINTMLCCANETFVDCPYYEQQQYDMDATIEIAIWERMTRDTRLVRKCVEEFAASQQDSGLILANYPATYKQIIPGFSLFWIFMLSDYLDWTKDISFVKRFVGNVDKNLDYFDRTLSPEGLVTRGDYWDFVDWVPAWEAGEPVAEKGKAITIYTMYYAYALLQAADICEKVGRAAMSEDYKKKYQSIKAALLKHCFDGERGLFRDSTDGGYSMHTIIWAILAEIKTGADAKKLLSHIDDPDVSKSSFSMNYYLFRALEKCGMLEKIFENFGGWQKMIDLNCTTWCENPDSPRSECHGWSSAPLYEFSSNILGVKVGFSDEIVIAPVVPGKLTFAKGTVPTRFGCVNVSWTKDEVGFEINIKAPAGVRKKLVMPDGEIKIFEENVTEI